MGCGSSFFLSDLRISADPQNRTRAYELVGAYSAPDTLHSVRISVVSLV